MRSLRAPANTFYRLPGRSSLLVRQTVARRRGVGGAQAARPVLLEERRRRPQVQAAAQHLLVVLGPRLGALPGPLEGVDVRRLRQGVHLDGAADAVAAPRLP